MIDLLGPGGLLDFSLPTKSVSKIFGGLTMPFRKRDSSSNASALPRNGPRSQESISICGRYATELTDSEDE